MKYHGCRLLILIFGGMIFAALQGCASLYLHDASTQKQTDSAKAAVDTVNIDGIFKSEAAYLDKLQTSESSIVAAKFATERDADVFLILNGAGKGGLNGLALLRSRIDGYLKALVGVTDVGCDVKLSQFVEHVDPWQTSEHTDELTAFETGFDQFQARIQSQCPGSTATELPLPSPTPNLLVSIQMLQSDLSAIDVAQKSEKGAEDSLKTNLSNIEKALSAGKTEEASVDDDLKKLQQGLTDSDPVIREFASATLSDELATTIQALGPAGNAKSSVLEGQERAGVALVQAVFGVGDAFSSPPKVPHPNTLAAAQAWLNYTGSQAAIQLDGERALFGDHQRQFAAVLTEIYYLSEAGEEIDRLKIPHGALKDGTQGLANLLGSRQDSNTLPVDGAVIYYASAWTRGFSVDAVASRCAYIDERRSKLAGGSLAASAWMGLLKPAVYTLANYGAGGFDPEIIAQLLQSFGVAAIAVGVNK